MRILSDAQVKMRMTPMQSMFAQVIENMESKVQKVESTQQENLQTDKSQTQQLHDINSALTALKRDYDFFKRTCEKEAYDQTNLERNVLQLQNDNRNLERRISQLERQQ